MNPIVGAMYTESIYLTRTSMMHITTKVVWIMSTGINLHGGSNSCQSLALQPLFFDITANKSPFMEEREDTIFAARRSIGSTSTWSRLRILKSVDPQMFD